MKTAKLILALTLVLGALFAIPKAEARPGFSISFNTGGYSCAPAYSYYRPRPVYVAPRVVYRRPARVYYHQRHDYYRSNYHVTRRGHHYRR